jgi:hypothetical protein
MACEERITVISCVCAWCKETLRVVNSAWIGIERTETHGICEACHHRLDELDSSTRKARGRG